MCLERSFLKTDHFDNTVKLLVQPSGSYTLGEKSNYKLTPIGNAYHIKVMANLQLDLTTEFPPETFVFTQKAAIIIVKPNNNIKAIVYTGRTTHLLHAYLHGDFYYITGIYTSKNSYEISKTQYAAFHKVAKPSIHIYNPSKINDQLKNNHLLKKYLPIYEKENLAIPYPIETLPSHGISGSYTLPEAISKNLANSDINSIEEYSHMMVRYFMTMYAGPKITDVNDIIHRINRLFVKDNALQNNPQNLIPIMQHMLSFDTFNLMISRQHLTYMNNINVSAKYITAQKHVEIITIEKTHSFLSNDEIRVIDENNHTDLTLLRENSSLINAIVKQPFPDFIGIRILGINNKAIYPIDTKLITLFEKNLDMLASHNSLSLNYDSMLAAAKIKGQFSVLQTRFPQYLSNKSLIDQFNEFDKIFLRSKNNLTENEFTEIFKLWTIDLFQSQANVNNNLKHLSLLPSLIADSSYRNNNNPYLNTITNDIALYNMIKEDIKT